MFGIETWDIWIGSNSTSATVHRDLTIHWFCWRLYGSMFDDKKKRKRNGIFMAIWVDESLLSGNKEAIEVKIHDLCE